MRVFLFGETSPFQCVNFDNDEDAENLINSDIPSRELSALEIKTAFSGWERYAGDKLTKVDGNSLQTAIVSRDSSKCTKGINEVIEKLQHQLSKNDLASVRPLRAKVAGTAKKADEARLGELEEQAQKLRTELAALLVG
ncbi:MAG: hypothetical protein ACERJ1_08690 [Halodesulfovibrio sp.]|uniref:hypothetical protein n=1 Tax=Halodesulfovibrio sp. TaxID=1912772 RepID=UPI00359E6893